MDNAACTWGPMAPVHQFVLSLNDGAQLCGPVAVLLLVHEEVDALPHQVLLCPTEHVLVAQQHLQHRGEAVGCACQEEGCEGIKHAPHQTRHAGRQHARHTDTTRSTQTFTKDYRRTFASFLLTCGSLHILDSLV